MRYAILAACLALGACSGPTMTANGAPGKLGDWRIDGSCFLQTSGQAFGGNFADIVLPTWVPGTHLKAGQVSSCMAP